MKYQMRNPALPLRDAYLAGMLVLSQYLEECWRLDAYPQVEREEHEPVEDYSI